MRDLNPYEVLSRTFGATQFWVGRWIVAAGPKRLQLFDPRTGRRGASLTPASRQGQAAAFDEDWLLVVLHRARPNVV